MDMITRKSRGAQLLRGMHMRVDTVDALTGSGASGSLIASGAPLPLTQCPGELLGDRLHADRQHCRLQHDAQHACRGTKTAGDVSGTPPPVEGTLVDSGPQVADAPCKPMPASTSALRIEACARLSRAPACSVASRVGRRDRISVSTVSETRTRAPTMAASPSSGWKA